MTTTSYTAYSLNVYHTSTTADGMVGRITDDGTAITPIPNMTSYSSPTPGAGDPEIEGFVNGANLQIATAPYAGGTGEAVGIYDATTGTATLGSPYSWTNVFNMYGIEKVGSFLYVLDFDNARVVEVNAATFAQTGKVFNFATDATTKTLYNPATQVPHGQAILNVGGVLYGLFSIADSTWTTYQNSVLVKFTITAGAPPIGSIKVGANDYNNGIGKNAFAMAVQGSDLYIASLGGRQVAGTPNINSRLDKIAYGASPLNGATVTQPVTYSTVGYEIRDISFDGSTAYLLVGSYNGSYVMEGQLLETTTSFGSFSTIDGFTGGASGYLWAAQYIDNNRILFARGNEIRYYDAASTAVPVATLTITSGSLMAAPNTSYTNLNDISYVGAKTTTPLRARGYRSPVQVSKSARGIQARALAQGRPELTQDELARLEDLLA